MNSDMIISEIINERENKIFDEVKQLYKDFITFASDNGIKSFTRAGETMPVSINEEEISLDNYSNLDSLMENLDKFVEAIGKEAAVAGVIGEYQKKEEAYQKAVEKKKQEIEDAEDDILIVMGAKWLREYLQNYPSAYEKQIAELVDIYANRYSSLKTANLDGIDFLRVVRDYLKSQGNVIVLPLEYYQLNSFIEDYDKFDIVSKKTDANVQTAEFEVGNLEKLSVDELKNKIAQEEKFKARYQKELADLNNSGSKDSNRKKAIGKQIADCRKRIEMCSGVYLLKVLEGKKALSRLGFTENVLRPASQFGSDKKKKSDFDSFCNLRDYIRGDKTDNKILKSELNKAKRSLKRAKNDHSDKDAKTELDNFMKSSQAKPYVDLLGRKDSAKNDYNYNIMLGRAITFIGAVISADPSLTQENVGDKVNEYFNKIAASATSASEKAEIEKNLADFGANNLISVDDLVKITTDSNIDKIKEDLQDFITETKFKSKAIMKGNKEQLVLKAFVGLAAGGLGVAVSMFGKINPYLELALNARGVFRLAKEADKKFNGGRITNKISGFGKGVISYVSPVLSKIPGVKTVANNSGFQKVKSGVQTGLKMIDAVLKNPYVSVSIDGFTAGYFLGKNFVKPKLDNMVRHPQQTTPAKPYQSPNNTRNLLEKNSQLENNSWNPFSRESRQIKFPNGNTGGNVVSDSVDYVSDFVPGQTYDLSQITKGYAASGATPDQAVNLVKGVADHAAFDKSVVRNGETWYHFLQNNGQYYSWFPESALTRVPR